MARARAFSFWYVFWQFVKLSLVGWGGPVARMALLHEEFVRRKKWMSEQHFAKILGVYQVLPGPEATELAVYFGYKNKGRLGGLLSGLGFMLPGFLLMLLASWFYGTYGLTLAPLQAFLYGIKPAAVALITLALISIGKSTITNTKLGMIAAGAAIAFFFHVNFVIVLAFGGLLAWLFTRSKQLWLLAAAPATSVLLTTASLPLVFWVGLKVGLLTFGGAYSVVPFIYQEAVQRYGWLTAAQYVDGLAIAQVLPAPLSIIATFAGYAGGGVPGAVLATVGVFLPAFLFTLLGFNTIEYLAENKKLHVVLSGVTAAVVGLILATLVDLVRTSLFDVFTICLAIVAFLLLWRKTNIAIVILGAGLLGYLFQTFI